jgi:GNAT superfamily N-acetyltransferase
MGTEGDYPGMAAAFEHWLRREVPAGTYRGWVVEYGEAAVVVAGGGLIVLPWSPGPVVLDPRCAFVFNVYTDPAHRRRGLARRLMEAMHDWCRSHGIRRIALNASRDGQPIYEAMGYMVAAEPMLRLTL